MPGDAAPEMTSASPEALSADASCASCCCSAPDASPESLPSAWPVLAVCGDGPRPEVPRVHLTCSKPSRPHLFLPADAAAAAAALRPLLMRCTSMVAAPLRSPPKILPGWAPSWGQCGPATKDAKAAAASAVAAETGEVKPIRP